MLKQIILSIALFSLISCGIKSSSEASSAIYQNQALLGSLAGQIQLTKYKVAVKPSLDTIPICIDIPLTDGRRDNFLFEIKLATATWMHAAGFSDVDWKKIIFDDKKVCEKAKNRIGSSIKLTTNRTTLADNNYEVPFLACSRVSATTFRCLQDSFTLGFGGPAQFSLVNSTPENTWTGIEFRSAAMSSLNPYVKWVSLQETIQNHPTLDIKVKNGLLGRLNGLKEKQIYGKYVEFSDLLKKYLIKDTSKNNFEDAQQKAVSYSLFGMRIPLLKTASSYNVLLHELGHQFGLDHPKKSVKVAVMSYNEPILYLSEDDLDGIRRVMTLINEQTHHLTQKEELTDD